MADPDLLPELVVPGHHLGDSPGALGDHHEVDDDQDQEYDHPHNITAPHNEVAESTDNLTGCAWAFVTPQKDETCGGHVV